MYPKIFSVVMLPDPSVKVKQTDVLNTFNSEEDATAYIRHVHQDPNLIVPENMNLFIQPFRLKPLAIIVVDPLRPDSPQ